MLLQVYDPPMCCSTGVCGPAVDPGLAQFAADLRSLESQGCRVERFNLAQQPQAFASNAAIKDRMVQHGNSCLPLILLDGKVVSEGRYPSLEELAGWTLAAEDTAGLFSPAIAELVAIGASVAVGCEACFEHHWQAARRLGVSEDDIARAVETAEAVKRTPARRMREVVKEHLGSRAQGKRVEAASSPACCGPDLVELGKTGSKCC